MYACVYVCVCMCVCVYMYYVCIYVHVVCVCICAVMSDTDFQSGSVLLCVDHISSHDTVKF